MYYKCAGTRTISLRNVVQTGVLGVVKYPLQVGNPEEIGAYYAPIPQGFPSCSVEDMEASI